MWGDYFVRFKDELTEIWLTIKQMIRKPLMMMLHCLWIVITFQEKDYIEKAKKAGEQDRKNIDHQMPNEFIQGGAIGVSIIKLLNFKIVHIDLMQRLFNLRKTLV
jgi:hypothetical protein